MSDVSAENVMVGDWGGADPFEPSFRDDPYPAMNRLRENDPVNLTPVGTWRISRYADVADVFRNAPTSMTLPDGSSPNMDDQDNRGSFREFMLNKDGPDHIRLRRLVLGAFTPRALKNIENQIELIVSEALDKALKEGGMEVVEDLALRVPSRMICRIMGLPEEDIDLFTEWTAMRTNAFFARFLPEEVVVGARKAGEDMADYFEDMIKKRRAQPTDDLLSNLIQSEEDGDRLGDVELAVQAIGLLTAGFETTIGLIGNGTRAFIENPDQSRLLKEQPDLAANAVEECLRFDTPVLFNWRVLTEEYQVGDTLLPNNSVLWMMLGSANHDPLQFDNPDVFDIQRKDVGHISFGGGAHTCLGNQLARMEARNAFRSFCERMPQAKICYDEFQWSDSFFRVMGKMPIEFN
eukprot:s1_g207.t1